MLSEERVPPCRRSYLLANFDPQNLSLVNTSTLLVPQCTFRVSQSLRNSEDTQALQTLHRQNWHYTGAFHLIRPAGLVQNIPFVLEGTGGCSSWSLPQFPPLHLCFSSYSFLMGHYFVHEVINAGINCLKLQRTRN